MSSSAKLHASALRRMADYLDALPDNVVVITASTDLDANPRVHVYRHDDFKQLADGCDIEAFYNKSSYVSLKAVTLGGIELNCCFQPRPTVKSIA